MEISNTILYQNHLITTLVPLHTLPTTSTPHPMKNPPAAAAAAAEPYRLTASSIHCTKSATNLPFPFKQCIAAAQPTYILRDISLTANPGEILAVVGPSGAGKSTLLDILAARISPTAGTIFLNSVPIKNPSSYRKLSSYVPQHDAFFPLLTVSETFFFAGRLLLSDDTSTISNIVGSLLKELNLTHVAETKLARGLSGGERRRVSIGLSLLHDPGLILLDEPTSGLDSKSAFDVIQILKSIATSRQRTVVLSIHQPSFKILSVIDRLLLLSKGTVVYHGRLDCLETFLLYKGFTVPPQLNSLEYAMEILHKLQESNKNTDLVYFPDPSPSASTIAAGPALEVLFRSDWRGPINNRGLSIGSIKHQNQPPAGRSTDHQSTRNRKQSTVRYRTSRITEISLLLRRFWKIIYRTKQLLLTNTLEALIVGLVLGTIYINIGLGQEGIKKRFGLFAFTLTFLLSSTTETLPIFINERPILLRETSSGIYRLSSYILANTLVFLPYLLVIAIIYSVSVYFLVGLCHSWQAFVYFVIVIWAIVLMANSFVMFLSSLAPNYISGTSLLTLLLAGFFLFSGYFISKDSLPRYWICMHYLSMYKYALDALLINEYSCLVSKCMVWLEGEGYCMLTGNDVLVKRGLSESQRWTNVYVLLGFFVMYRVLCFLVLIRRISISK